MPDWTGADLTKLRRMWGLRARSEIEASFPNRSWKAITSRAGKLGLYRQSHARQPLPVSNHPLLEQIRLRMQERAFTATDLQECAGIKRGVLSQWFTKCAEPKLQNVERAITALGGRLQVVWDDLQEQANVG